ncbi:MAG TPA: alpha/beta hydrolase [Casimicrobiaceae bacterium]|nr:alpha/beta hydrolase [Casimicrobiaceae bacterium]
MLDPDIRRLLDTIFSAPAPAGRPDIAQLRAAAELAPKLLGGAAESVEDVRDATVPGIGVPVRIYRAAGTRPMALTLFAHGGGWVTGSLDSHDKLCRILANALGSVIVAVDYRRAPEHVYPAALDDLEAAWHWLRERAASLGAEGRRFLVAGDSSGGNLAAALTLRLAGAGAVQPDLQVLLYPALDARCSGRSYREFATGHNLTATQMQWYWDAYRGDAGVDDAGLSPLAAADLAGLPPAVIAVASADVLRDDGLDYARALQAARVPVRLVECHGMIHGFLRWTGEVSAARRWIDRIAEAAGETFTARAKSRGV